MRAERVTPNPLQRRPSRAAVGLAAERSTFEIMARLTPERSARSAKERAMASRRCFKWAAILCSIPDWVDFIGSVSDRQFLSIIVDASSQGGKNAKRVGPRLKLGLI